MVYEGTVVAARFEIASLAGRGGMGAVYRARDRQTGGEAAIKILHGEVTPAHVERFGREAALLAELAHPAVVRYLSHGATERGDAFLAMEWLAGEDLSQRLAREGLGAEDSIVLVRRIAEALGAAHARGIIHRDIKPSNVMLVDRDVARAKLLDFGIARIRTTHDSITRTGAVMGTPGYMAPEQARGARDVDARADVFSLGCMLFQCLTGSPPFMGDSPMAILAKILLEDAPPLRVFRDDLPPILETLVARMLAKSPEHRQRDAGQVASELEQLGAITRARGRTSDGRESAVTTGEQRLVCLVLAQRAVPRPSAAPPTPLTVPQIEYIDDRTLVDTSPPGTGPQAAVMAKLSDAALEHGGKVDVLADGSLVISVTGQGTATDQAARAARCALAVRRLVPLAPMALVIGRGAVGGRAPLGALIDRAVGLLSVPVMGTAATAVMDALTEATATLPIRVDEVAGGLLDIRFEIGGDDQGLVLRGERDVTDSMRTLLGKPTPCVGRDRELATLASIFDECTREPMSHVVLVTSPAGTGKSRLRHEFLAKSGAEAWIGRGNPMSAGAPLAMLGAALRRGAGIAAADELALRQMKLRARVARSFTGDDATRVCELVGEIIGAPIADEHASLPLRTARADPQLMADQMLRACEDYIRAACAERPLILVLEDLQWGDLSTVRFVDAIVRQLPDRPLMVLALARPEVDAVFPRLWTERSVERIQLGELTRRAGEKLVKSVLGDDLDDASVARLVDRAAGNAFYLEELIRAVAEGKGDRLPETVVAMAQARIEALELEARHVLRAASIFGQTFWLGGLAALLRGAGTQAQDWLDELVARELLVVRRESRFPGEREYGFRQQLVREAAYTMLTDRDLTRGHLLAGAWLEAHIGASPSEADAVALAEHFDRGDEPRRAFGWYRRAAEVATSRDDLGAAIERADKAIGCLWRDGGTSQSPADRAAAGALRQLQASAHVWRGEYDLAIERGEGALVLLDAGTVPWLTALAAVADARTRKLEAAPVIELAHELADIAPAPHTQRALAHAIAIVVPTLLYAKQEADTERRLLDRLAQMEITAIGADPATLAWIFHARSWRAMHDGDFAACLALDTRVVECFTAVGDVRHAAQQQANVAYDELRLGAWARAAESFGEAIRQAGRIGLPQVTATALHNLGFVLLHLGRIDDARRVETTALRTFEAQANARLTAASHHYLAHIELAAGDVPAAMAHARASVDGTPDTPGLRTQFHATLATCYRLTGDTAAALAHATTALSLIEQHGPPEEGEGEVLLSHAEALRASGDHAGAARAIARAEARVHELAAKIGDPTWRKSFLEAIPDHGAIHARAKAWQ